MQVSRIFSAPDAVPLTEYNYCFQIIETPVAE